MSSQREVVSGRLGTNGFFTYAGRAHGVPLLFPYFKVGSGRIPHQRSHMEWCGFNSSIPINLIQIFLCYSDMAKNSPWNRRLTHSMVERTAYTVRNTRVRVQNIKTISDQLASRETLHMQIFSTHVTWNLGLERICDNAVTSKTTSTSRNVHCTKWYTTSACS
jgi:hypothetical protein